MKFKLQEAELVNVLGSEFTCNFVNEKSNSEMFKQRYTGEPLLHLQV